MIVQGGAACAIAFQPAPVSVQNFAIATPPEHGTAVLRGRAGVVYTPAPGFRGDDFFAFSLRGRSAFYEEPAVVRVHVSMK